MLTSPIQTFTAQPHFLAAHIISIEVDLSPGLHSFSIVGLAGKATDEAKDRIAAAIKNSGWKSPKSRNQKIVISLSPANLRKDSTVFDVAMSVAYLIASKDVVPKNSEVISKTFFIGELSLHGKIQRADTIIPLLQAAKRSGFISCFIPKENAVEAGLIHDIDIYPAETLQDITNHIEGVACIPKQEKTIFSPKPFVPDIDMSDIQGQYATKRALEIAIAGGHNIVLYGPAGTGKTMLARATAGIMPPLSFTESLELTTIHSLYAHTKDPENTQSLVTIPPFRAPHHTASQTALIGGGSTLRPGEITLAHRGILFLDEMLEFPTQTLETLREPLEEGIIRLTRARGSVVYPARFILIGALNPCFCGNFGSEGRICTCSPLRLSQYRSKLSGPLRDRIDMWSEVSKVEHHSVIGRTEKGETSLDIQKRILRARTIQKNRYAHINLHVNKEVPGQHIHSHIHLDPQCKKILIEGSERVNLSARGQQSAIKIARTIADLANTPDILPEHIHEAFSYRLKNWY